MSRIFNFSAGPSMLPESVLKRAQAEILDYSGTGTSVMEMSHRSKAFEEIISHARELFREILSVPADYEILFMQGGATAQFAAVPLNLLKGASGAADYIITGNFANAAYKEAVLLAGADGEIRIAGTGEASNFAKIPEQSELSLNPKASYVHICENNTIYGTKWHYIPNTAGVPLIADMSSSLLSEPVDVSKYGLIYAGVQKNIAPAGMAVVIVKKDLLGETRKGTPTILNYQKTAEKESMYNTPPCWSIYMSMLVLEWLKGLGGLSEMKKKNIEKAALLYDYLDASDFYKAVSAKENRSLMNVTFRTGDADLDAKFASEAAAAGLSNLKGHRSVGGMRASIYNAMPKEGVLALLNFMKEFERTNG